VYAGYANLTLFLHGCPRRVARRPSPPSEQPQLVDQSSGCAGGRHLQVHLHLCLTPPPQLAAPPLLPSPLPKPPPSQQPPPPQPASPSPQLFTCSLRPLSYLQVRLRLHAEVGGEAGGAARPPGPCAGDRRPLPLERGGQQPRPVAHAAARRPRLRPSNLPLAVGLPGERPRAGICISTYTRGSSRYVWGRGHSTHSIDSLSLFSCSTTRAALRPRRILRLGRCRLAVVCCQRAPRARRDGAPYHRTSRRQPCARPLPLPAAHVGVHAAVV
jgi:hypothetical protein